MCLLELAGSGIHVASYWTRLVLKKKLERKLHQAITRARGRLDVTTPGHQQRAAR